MCGGGGDKAVKQQEKYERERQARANQVASQVRGVFSTQKRADEISQYESDTEKFYRNYLDQQHGTAAREMKFALARTGQAGSQVAIDKGGDLTRQYNEGALKVSRAAQQAGARLRAADQETQSQLIGMAQSGLEIGNASALAMSGMRNNFLAAKAEAVPEGLGQAFSGLADTYQFSQEAKAYQRGYEQTKTGNGTPTWMTGYGNTNNSTPAWMIGGGG